MLREESRGLMRTDRSRSLFGGTWVSQSVLASFTDYSTLTASAFSHFNRSYFLPGAGLDVMRMVVIIFSKRENARSTVNFNFGPNF